MKDKIDWFWDCAAPVFYFLVLLPLCLVAVDWFAGRVISWEKIREYLLYGALFSAMRLLVLGAHALKLYLKKKKGKE